MTGINDNKLAVLAFSGGLDTSFCTSWLVEQGFKVHTVYVNTGGHASAAIERMEARALQCGASRHVQIDAREQLYSGYLRYLLYANARRGNAYPLCVSAERICQAQAVADYALQHGAAAIAHGSTGAGNDQLRFDTVFRVMAPELELLAPVRQLSASRAFEVQYLAERGIEVDSSTGKYSVNAGMWGMTIGGQETHGSWDALPEAAWPQADAEPGSRELLLSFENGDPVALDGQPGSAVQIIEELNAIGTAHGIGRGMHLGDTVLGIKGRIGFSAPAAHILIEAHRELEKLVLSSSQQFWKETLGNLYGRMVHEAQLLDPLCRDLEALLQSSQAMVSGDVRLRLMKGSLFVEGSRSPHSLMALQPAAYGEQSTGWSGQEVEAFNKLHAVAQQLSWQQGMQSQQGAGQ